jgi:hypothetical protein
VGIGHDFGRGFWKIYTKSLATIQKVLMLMPHMSEWETCILQTWIADFNSSISTSAKGAYVGDTKRSFW